MGLLNAARDVRTIKGLLTRAETEARGDGARAHGAEHLLLAALALPDGTAVRALGRVGVNPEQLRGAIAATHADALAAVGITAPPGAAATPAPAVPMTGAQQSTPQAQQVFQEAVALSKSQRPSLLRGGHVVAATCTLEHGTVVRALTALGVDRDQLRAAAHAEVGLA